MPLVEERTWHEALCLSYFSCRYWSMWHLLNQRPNSLWVHWLFITLNSPSAWIIFLSMDEANDTELKGHDTLDHGCQKKKRIGCCQCKAIWRPHFVTPLELRCTHRTLTTTLVYGRESTKISRLNWWERKRQVNTRIQNTSDTTWVIAWDEDKRSDYHDADESVCHAECEIIKLQ